MATQEHAIRRLQQTSNHLHSSRQVHEVEDLSIVHGPLEPALVDWTLGDLLDKQCAIRGEKECLIVPFSETRWTFADLKHESRTLAKGLLALGIQRGDRIGILAGNCQEYVALFFAAGYIGAILVVLNSTYTAAEAEYALNHSGCKLLFAEERYGRHSNTNLLFQIEQGSMKSKLETLIILRGTFNGYPTYTEVLDNISADKSDADLAEARKAVNTHDVCNFQYTSGSTGDPKAAMLTHHNLINNSHSIGARMKLGTSDMLCCPPPLFHCFGLVLGLLACFNHGSTLLLPSPTFSAPAVLSCLQKYPVTALHGVPAMFEELLSLPRPENWSCQGLRTGIVAGAPVPKALMAKMVEVLGMREFTSSYGLTEASPTCFNAETTETIERKLTTVGKILPHLHAKIVDRDGNIVPIGERGELYMSGYSLQKGYWKNQAKTDEAMVKDERGVLWLRTGDEARFDEEGYCTITGRFKDIIIRGGENIYPLEIESRLTCHPSNLISRAAVVGLKHVKYGEVVAAFLLQPQTDTNTTSTSTSTPRPQRPSDADLRAWVREVLGRHKAPAHIFWFGDREVGLDDVPQTGSGKVKKHVLRSVGQRLAEEVPLAGGVSGRGADVEAEARKREREQEQEQEREYQEGSSKARAETIFEYVYDENML